MLLLKMVAELGKVLRSLTWFFHDVETAGFKMVMETL